LSSFRFHLEDHFHLSNLRAVGHLNFGQPDC
jgi:hypothetical protein